MELLIIALVFYFLPAVIASCRGHHNQGAIFALNLLLGWTLLGWVAALVWSLTAVQAQAKVKVEAHGLINVLLPTPKPPAPKPFLPANWDRPKPTLKPVPQKSSVPVGILLSVGLGVLLIGVVIVAINHDAITAWLKPDAASGIQYTGTVAEGLTPDQVKKLEAQRDAIPVVQTMPPVAQSIPLPPKKLKSKGNTTHPTAVQ